MEQQTPSPRLFVTSLGIVFYVYRGPITLGGHLWHSWHVGIQSVDGKIYLTDQAIPQGLDRELRVTDALELARLVHEEPLLFARD